MITLTGMENHLFGGIQIRTDPTMTHRVEDWSNVRSPGRAARRRKRGFKQRIVIRTVLEPDVYRFGNTMVMHPETWARMRQDMEMANKDLSETVPHLA